MRQLDFQPKKKFRGNGRRLRAFNDRLRRIAQIRLTPDESEFNKYHHWKIPAPAKALHGRRRIANRWLKVWTAQGIEWLEQQDPQYISCVITGSPDAFFSEYCTFYCVDYFRSFINRQHVSQTWDRVSAPRPPCFMEGLDLSRYTLMEFDETVREDEDCVYRGKVFLLCHHLPSTT